MLRVQLVCAHFKHDLLCRMLFACPRMKSVTRDLEFIKTAVEASDLLELNEDGTKIRRKVVLPKDYGTRP